MRFCINPYQPRHCACKARYFIEEKGYEGLYFDPDSDGFGGKVSRG